MNRGLADFKNKEGMAKIGSVKNEGCCQTMEDTTIFALILFMSKINMKLIERKGASGYAHLQLLVFTPPTKNNCEV